MASSGINPASVEEVGPIVACAMNKDWADDRAAVLETINRYRLLLHTEYEKFQLFNNVFHCICVTTFKDCCTGSCDGEYQGFTLPANVMAPEVVWSYGYPLTLRSRWRESHTGIGVGGYGRVEAILMPETFCTERDLTEKTTIKFTAESVDDNDKIVRMEVLDADGRQKRIEITLVGEGESAATEEIKKILSVVLPKDLVGSLLLSQADDYALSNYYPWERVPVYQRMKVVSANCPSTILLQGTKRFQKVYFDYDIVEMGNQLIIESASRFFKYGQDTTDPNELKRARYDREEMERLILGEIARNTGHAQQDGSLITFKKNLNSRKRLTGYSR